MSFQRRFATVVATTALTGLFSVPVQAANLFASSVKFDKDTEVSFDFLESHGIYKSDFGVQQANGSFTSLLKEIQNADDTSVIGNNDWLGSCGISVKQCISTFTFKAGIDYTFALQNYEKVKTTNGWGYNDTSTTTVYSSTSQAVAYTKLSDTSYKLAWDDGYGGDRDTNDFIVKASWKKAASVPEPAALAGLFLVAGTLVISRRRKGVLRIPD
ncbi:PEP-CTERM sorting domain-containing protein [Microcoleus sp. FACHB-672]|uniref:PEP-CTERM sorting domain-containing protein n=1 Tax=Microcoleus sp. FACHB-672 TaxID=2692825 RepID=UPI001F54BF82|nr:PEP-CTERM sorting domain-containing protein [Microcoleus sp. FACHB-672]